MRVVELVLAGCAVLAVAEEAVTRGIPSVPIADAEGRNPAYDRQMFGTDMSHAWLNIDGDGSPFALVDSLFGAVDGTVTMVKDGYLDRAEILLRMEKVSGWVDGCASRPVRPPARPPAHPPAPTKPLPLLYFAMCVRTSRAQVAKLRVMTALRGDADLYALKHRFRTGDLDKDGFLNDDELHAMDEQAAQAKPVSAVFRWCDINKDGIVR
jgi:hypothetical protein